MGSGTHAHTAAGRHHAARAGRHRSALLLAVLGLAPLAFVDACAATPAAMAGAMAGALAAAVPALPVGTAAASDPAAEPCSDQRGFDRGRAGVAAAAHCSSGGYRSAWQLGSELAALQSERAELHSRLAQLQGERAHRVARRMRQLDIDIEAINGVLLLRGIVTEGPSAEESP